MPDPAILQELDSLAKGGGGGRNFMTPESQNYMGAVQGMKPGMGGPSAPTDPASIMLHVLQLLKNKAFSANRGSMRDPKSGKTLKAPEVGTTAERTVDPSTGQRVPKEDPAAFEMNQTRSPSRLSGQDTATMNATAQPYQGSDDELIGYVQQNMGNVAKGGQPGGQLDPGLLKLMQDFMAKGGDINQVIQQITGGVQPPR